MGLKRVSPRSACSGEKTYGIFETHFVVSSLLGVLVLSAVLLLAVFPYGTPRIFLNQRRAVKNIRNLNIAERNFQSE